LIVISFQYSPGTEFKSACCPVTGVMTALEIQKGARLMPSTEFHRELGATAACTVRMGQMHKASRPPGAPAGGLKGDSWFGSAKTAIELSRRGQEGVFQIKTGHRGYPKAFIEDAMKGMPGGVWLVMEGINKRTDEKLIAVGYRYSTKKTLCFVMTPGAGSTRKGAPYEMKFPTDHGNVGVRHVDRPDVISKYFKDSNCVDRHNQVRQFKLRIEKGWVTLNPYFRLFTTVLGIHVADCWKLAHYHNLVHQKKTTFFVDEDPEDSLPIKKFSGILSQQLLNMADCLKKKTGSTVSFVPPLIHTQQVEEETASSMESSSKSGKTLCSGVTDANGIVHLPVPFPSSEGRKGILPRRCTFCREEGVPNTGGWARHSCSTCKKAYCCPTATNGERDCFSAHVMDIRRTSRR